MTQNLGLERKEQLDLHTLQEILIEVDYLYHLQEETNKGYKAVAERIKEFKGKHYDLYAEQLARTQTRLYFGGEFYPFFALNELRNLRNEIRAIAEIIEKVMIVTEKQ